MNLYLLLQNSIRGYDTYDSMVIAAPSAMEAIEVHPDGNLIKNMGWRQGDDWPAYSDIDEIKVEFLDTTTHKAGVILASFNAG